MTIPLQTINPAQITNPFKSGPAPLTPDDLWICPENAWEQLAEAVDKHLNTVILGVKGSGKSTLLSKFFSDEFIKTSYAKNNLLVFSAVLSDTTTGDELCNLLINALCSAAEKALTKSKCAVLKDYREDLAETCVPKMQFIYLCEWLSGLDAQQTKKSTKEGKTYPSLKKGYTLLLFMDAFEKFVSRPEITEEQHNMLRSLLEREKNPMFCVVATDYDLEKTSLPPHAQSSLFIQKFQTSITMEGFSLEDAKAFIDKKMPADSPVQMSDARIKLLHSLTGGIPSLFEKGAHVMYNRLKKQPGVKKAEFADELYGQTVSTLQDWFKFFTPEYNAALQTILPAMPDNGRLQQFSISSTGDTAFSSAPLLKKRGFWTEGTRFGSYTFNSLLLQRYAAQGYLPSLPSAVAEECVGEAPKEKCYNVFISYKHEDGGVPTKDAKIALDLYETFRKVDGLVPFLDVKEIPNFKNNDFNDAIFAALKTAQALVIVCTNAKYMEESRYIKKERRFYNGLIDNHLKEEGSVYLVVDQPSLISSIPEEIRFFVDCDYATTDGMGTLVHKLRTRILR